MLKWTHEKQATYAAKTGAQFGSLSGLTKTKHTSDDVTREGPDGQYIFDDGTRWGRTDSIYYGAGRGAVGFKGNPERV